MKLQKQVAYKIDGKEYYKYAITLPVHKVEQLGWNGGIELIEEIKGDGLFIRALLKGEIKGNRDRPIYGEFRASIKNILERHPNGLTWTQIRDKLNYPQKFPNNKWVRKLEEDIDLKRVVKGKETIWSLENNTIYTIGYEGYTLDQFIKKLRDSNIEQLIDVREIALSRKNGFSKGLLGAGLKDAGIRYKHYPSLGSPKELRHQLWADMDYKKFFAEYKEHTKDQDVQDSIGDVQGISKMKKTVLLCFERDHKTCHRSIIAEELKRLGWKINHL